MLLPPGRNGRMSIINIMNSSVYHKYMSRGEMLSIYVPDALTITVYFTRLLTCLYLARAALIEFFHFCWRLLVVLHSSGAGVGVSPGLQRNLADCKPCRKRWNASWVCWQPVTNKPSGEHLIPVYHFETKAVAASMLMRLTVSLPIFSTFFPSVTISSHSTLSL